jgi:hypothetical protein
MELRRMSSVGHTVHMGERIIYAYRILIGKPDGKGLL